MIKKLIAKIVKNTHKIKKRRIDISSVSDSAYCFLSYL